MNALQKVKEASGFDLNTDKVCRFQIFHAQIEGLY